MYNVHTLRMPYSQAILGSYKQDAIPHDNQVYKAIENVVDHIKVNTP